MTRTLPTTGIVALLLLASLVAPTRAEAQHDTKGRRFWVTFMSNFNGVSASSDLRLYLASETPTTARLISFLTSDTVTIDIPLARTAVEFDIAATFGPDVELGYLEERARKAILVEADEEITCYGVNIRSLSADAFMSLPDDVLTNRYIVLAYPNAWSEGFGGGWYDQPSQFAIVATEDGTTVRIDPAARLMGRRRETFTITLDRGEVFNGQAVINEYQDVSGTEVRSNKPVAVYAGNRRVSIPLRIGNFRDHLVEQLPPLEVWGREAIVTPHAIFSPVVRDTAVVRVLAAFDDTKWQIDGVEQPPLARARSVELPLLRSMHITASAPILVAQYEHSAGYDTTIFGEVELPGDPFMMIIPPTEQFDTAYAFQSVEYFGFEELGHFVNIVIPTGGIASLRLDGGPVSASWEPTPKPGYSYARVNLRPGAHNIAADSAFGIFVYGFGPAISYGYPGGMLFRTLVHDFEPPLLEPAPLCLGLEGIALDSRITDTGIDSLYVLPQTRNVNVAIDPFTSAADTVRFRATLVDRYQDGILAIKAIDSAGRSRTTSNPIAGFTVRATGMEGNAPITLDTLRLFFRTDTCITVTLENYGLFPQTIRSVALEPQVTGVGVATPLPLTIAPGTSVPITLCAGDWADTIAVTEVRVVGECLDRTVAMLPIVTGPDSIPPEISSTVTCGRQVVLTFADRNAVGSKIRRIIVDSLINGRVVRQSHIPSSYVELELASIDPFRDLIYEVRVIDLAFNTTTQRDTIGGFTLAPLDARRDSVSERFDRELVVERVESGEERCDSIVLHNYGARTLRLTTIGFLGNHGYSVPPAQLPFEIPPHSDRPLVVCIDAERTGEIEDTLVLADGCGRLDSLVITTAATALLASDDCNSVLTIRTMGATKRSFLALPSPNPVTGATATVTFGLSADEPVTLLLLDAGGAVVERLLDAVPMRAGITSLETSVERLPAGLYFVRMSTPSGAPPVEKLVIHR